jgi:signal transduction histidine kinase
VLGDGDELKAAVYNLIDNAVKLAGRREGEGRAGVDGERARRGPVTDNGVGISPTN